MSVIKTAEENEFLTKLVVESKLAVVWLGATDEKREGRWEWIDGTVVKYDNWDRINSKQPNNALEVEHYIVLLADRKGRWWDYPADAKRYPGLTRPGLPGFVCEWE